MTEALCLALVDVASWILQLTLRVSQNGQEMLVGWTADKNSCLGTLLVCYERKINTHVNLQYLQIVFGLRFS